MGPGPRLTAPEKAGCLMVTARPQHRAPGLDPIGAPREGLTDRL